MKIGITIFAFLILALAYALSLQQNYKDVLPTFLIKDSIAEFHNTQINTTIHSLYIPTEGEISTLEKDYSALWAHLNYLYSTGDVIKGKEYYTEDWFKQLCNGSKREFASGVFRNDLKHDLKIINWENDGLLCTVSDSVTLKYQYINKSIDYEKVLVSMVLLLQGDNWRIDAIKVD